MLAHVGWWKQYLTAKRSVCYCLALTAVKVPWQTTRENVLTNQKRREQQGRAKAARKLLKQADCGEITIEGRTVKVKISPCGMLYGMGKDKNLRINPYDVQKPESPQMAQG